MLNFVKKIFGTKYERDVKKYDPIVDQIEEIYKELEKRIEFHGSNFLCVTHSGVP